MKSYVELAERLNAISPIPTAPAKSLLAHNWCGSGRERGEDRARRDGAQRRDCPFSGAFHGRSAADHGAHRQGRRPTSTTSVHWCRDVSRRISVWPLSYRRHLGAGRSCARWKQCAQRMSMPQRVAAIIHRAGAGRGRLPHRAAWHCCNALRATCDTHGILLIADESPDRPRPYRQHVRHPALGR